MTNAKIFLAEERGLHQLNWFRSYTTFNADNYHNEYKTPVSRLYMLKDDTLAGGKSCTHVVATSSLLLLLPVAGAIEYRDSTGNASLLDAGNLQTILLPAGSHYTVTNPYAAELVNFLQICIALNAGIADAIVKKYMFGMHNQQSLFSSMPLDGGVKFHIATFNGRQKAVVPFATNTAVFAFVISGAFELEERLLHARDGLALWNCTHADMEALSNQAVVLLLELL
jgi:quercetin 2,3-dioxygenase